MDGCCEVRVRRVLTLSYCITSASEKFRGKFRLIEVSCVIRHLLENPGISLLAIINNLVTPSA